MDVTDGGTESAMPLHPLDIPWGTEYISLGTTLTESRQDGMKDGTPVVIEASGLNFGLMG